MVKINIKNSVFEKCGSIGNFQMPAYLECGACKEHSTIDGNGGKMECPKCGSGHMARMEIGGGKPSWFKEGKA